MAGPDQPKTKAELLRELQSIQSLLDEQGSDGLPDLDDEDIPILDEFIEPDDDHSHPLAADDEKDETLDALNAAYAALTGDIDAHSALEKDNRNEEATEPPQKSLHAQETTASADAPSDAQQAIEAPAHALLNAEPSADEPEDRDDPGAHEDQLGRHGSVAPHSDPAAPAPLPGQQSLFDGPAKPSHHSSISPRPAQVTKASGENPFLPQHIRERLRGNQPLPKGEFIQPATPPAHLDLSDLPKPEDAKPDVSTAEVATEVDIPETPAEPEASPATTDPEPAAQPALSNDEVMQLVDELVAEHLPKIEQQLREQLLAKLTQQASTEH